MKNNICQSCGMRMYHLTDFGTNSDSSINTEFCNDCFQIGVFVDHGISLEEKIEKNIDIAHNSGMTREEGII